MRQSPRPVFLNPMKIRMPVGAVTSIAHRITGILLAAAVPVSVYLFDLSLRSEQAFAAARTVFEHMAIKAVLVIVIWALSHHLLAGIRHLLSDFNLGSPLRTARRSAWLVNAGGVAMALLAAGALL
ncbi:MAG: succinate dehydrogenase, cytochrome b556 subunit [Cytophagales bacterium]|nr:succinate dehydrogenase, cytochrome b556 subunit [Rhizobacter sp.]